MGLFDVCEINILFMYLSEAYRIIHTASVFYNDIHQMCVPQASILKITKGKGSQQGVSDWPEATFQTCMGLYSSYASGLRRYFH